jgi:hypothetical protein
MDARADKSAPSRRKINAMPETAPKKETYEKATGPHHHSGGFARQ